MRKKKKTVTVTPCPQAHLHTPHPEGYLQHASWAEHMMKTHIQHQCPGCGLWAIWKRKQKV